MADANQELFDASLRHQIGVRRFTSGEAKRALELLQKSDRELVKKLRERLASLEGREIDVRSERYKALIKDIRALRAELWIAYRELVREGLVEFAVTEQEFERKLIDAALPVEVSFAAASAATLRASVVSQPFAGGPNAARTLQEWFDSLAAADQRRLVDAITLGLTQQESVDDIVRRVAGTKAQNYADGVLAMTRRNAEAVVRTAVNHVSNIAREEFWLANDDLIAALKWNATLDGRTSATCRGRDGHFVIVGEDNAKFRPLLQPQTARPPAHPNCRSVMVAILDPEGVADQVGERPFVRDDRTRKTRERDFRAEAKERYGSKWSSMSASQRNAAVRDVRDAWAQKAIGQVPADVDYDTWLRRQPASFQDDVLGVKKAKAFRRGLKLDQFIDRNGTELTLEQLRATRPEYFRGD